MDQDIRLRAEELTELRLETSYFVYTYLFVWETLFLWEYESIDNYKSN